MSSEGELFVTETLEEIIEQKYKNSEIYKKLKDVANKVGDGELYYNTEDFPDTNNFAEFPDSGDIKIYTKSNYERFFIGVVHFEIEFDEAWAWKSIKDPVGMAYSDPIKDVSVELEIYDEPRKG